MSPVGYVVWEARKGEGMEGVGSLNTLHFTSFSLRTYVAVVAQWEPPFGNLPEAGNLEAGSLCAQIRSSADGTDASYLGGQFGLVQLRKRQQGGQEGDPWPATTCATCRV